MNVFLTFLNVIIPGREVSGLAVGIFHSQELFFCRVFIVVRDDHWCSEIRLKQMVLPKQDVCMLVESLNLAWIDTGSQSSFPSSNLPFFHTGIPLHGKGNEVDLENKRDRKIILITLESMFSK